VAAATAIVGWTALTLQLFILVSQIGPTAGVWRFLGYFTILSNIGVATIATAAALGSTSELAGPRARIAGLTSILTVGLVYSLVLRSTWNPQGLQKLVDTALHDWTPILFAVLWALMPHGDIRWRDMKWALGPPAAYLVYSMARGAVEGWYPYHFLDPTMLSATGLAVGVLGTLSVVAAIAASAIAIDLKVADRRQ
jgi:hypothetical protein